MIPLFRSSFFDASAATRCIKKICLFKRTAFELPFCVLGFACVVVHCVLTCLQQIGSGPMLVGLRILHRPMPLKPVLVAVSLRTLATTVPNGKLRLRSDACARHVPQWWRCAMFDPFKLTSYTC